MASGLFSISRSALLTNQQVLQTIAHNIANAETPGYSRQEAIVTPNTPVRFSYGMVGTGVHVETVIRKRDVLLDEGFRSASGRSGETSMRRDSLSSVEDIFGEPSDSGMSSALDQFWNAWSDLSSSPSSTAARAVVQQRGRQAAGLLNQYNSQLTQQSHFTLERINTVVGEINQIAEQVADLNGRITSSGQSSAESGDLADQRDLLLDRLSTMAGTRVIPQGDNSVVVVIGNSTLVDGTTARPLNVAMVLPTPPPATASPDVPVQIRLGSSIDALKPLGGQLRAMVDIVNKDVPEMRLRLDALASSLVTSVNAAHTQGFVFSGTTLPGTAAGNFFDPGSVPAPVTAGTIQLSAAVEADINEIAASSDNMAPLDNSVANMMTALRNDATTVSFTSGATSETGSFLSFFRSTVTRLGLEVRVATDDSTVASTMTDQAELRRQSVSGVNTDEELVHMLRVQQAYTAATKLISTADEMLQTLLSLV